MANANKQLLEVLHSNIFPYNKFQRLCLNKFASSNTEELRKIQINAIKVDIQITSD